MNRSRRDFLKGAAMAVAVAPLLKTLPAFAQDKEVSQDDPIAKALGYHSDATKVDVKAFPAKAVPAAAKANCSNCMLYQAGGVKIGDGVYGKCTAIPSGLVNEKGWCSAWAAKAS